jgi:outer membrane protein assembly factor BamB
MKTMNKRKLLFTVFGCLFLILPAENVKQPAWKIYLAGECAGAPAVFAGKAIVAAKNGRLYSLDGSGKLLWKQKLPSGCLAAPAIDRNGDIYAACANGSLLRFSASGKPVWQVELKQELLATPLLAGETLFTVSGAGRVCKIRKKDGVVLKQAELHMPVHASPVWDAERKNLLVPVKDYFLVAIGQELQVVWKFRTAGVILSSAAVTPGNEIYFTSMDHHLYKLNAAGRLLWKYKARGWIKASPVIDEQGRVYFGSYDRCFYAVSSDGRPLWQFQGKAQFTASAAIDEADNLYCGDNSGTVYALDRAGRLSWQYKSPDFITADLTIMPEKILLAGSIDGTLLAFRTGQPMSKKAWWAKYLGNLSNSGFDEE